jgi:transcriptional regulator
MGDPSRAEVLQGTFDLLILKTLDTLGSQHGYAIAQRILQISGEALALNQGTLYPALLRLEQRGLIKSKIGVSDNNRRARFYSLTPNGRNQLTTATDDWRIARSDRRRARRRRHGCGLQSRGSDAGTIRRAEVPARRHRRRKRCMKTPRWPSTSTHSVHPSG